MVPLFFEGFDVSVLGAGVVCGFGVPVFEGYCRLTNKLTECTVPFDVNSQQFAHALKGKYVLPFIITGDIFEPSVSVKFANRRCSKF